MRNNNVLGLLFSNMHDEALRELTGIRALGSVPFGGRYRLIDFPLSNMVNAGISKVGVITKSNYQSLMDHIGSGKSWDLSRKNEGLYFLPPFGTSDEMYNGRIASLNGIQPFLRNSKEEYVVLSDCHVVGNIDYDRLVETHLASGADITVAYKRGPVPPMTDNLLLYMDPDGRVNDMILGPGGEEKGAYGLGLYTMAKSVLMRLISAAVSRNRMHFERDVLQRHVDTLRIYGYEVPEYTAVICSLNSYFQANMDLLDPGVRAALFPSRRPIYTKVRDCAPAVYGLHATVKDSLVADGSKIDGSVSRSIIFRDVQIERDAVLENCIVMQGSVICKNSRLGAVIMDKDVVVKEGRTLTGFESYPVFVSKGSVV